MEFLFLTHKLFCFASCFYVYLIETTLFLSQQKTSGRLFFFWEKCWSIRAPATLTYVAYGRIEIEKNCVSNVIESGFTGLRLVWLTSSNG